MNMDSTSDRENIWHEEWYAPTVTFDTPQLKPSAMSSTGIKQGCGVKHHLEVICKDLGNVDEARRSLNDAIAFLQDKVKALATPESHLVDDAVPHEEYDVDLEHPFLVQSPTKSAWTLPFSTTLAKTRAYDRQWTVLPNSVANIPCENAEPHEVLRCLNVVFDTQFELTTEVETCLAQFINDGLDLGEIYGYLRPWMPDADSERDFVGVISNLHQSREEDVELRAAAIVGTRIVNPKVPPRRVWDLYSNRVLPYYALRPEIDLFDTPRLPHQLWAVSHSWVDVPQRQYVVSPINGRSWPVPIPLNTTLDEIRNELLILGAEYVWLDVLCLRQKDQRRTGAEDVRKREWKIDVPTIGHIYTESLHRTVIIYFNGLGLPFRDGPVDPNDRFHWCNRAWALQEGSTSYIIPGGLEHKIGRVRVHSKGSCGSAWATDPDFIRHFDESLLRPRDWDLATGEIGEILERNLNQALTLRMVIDNSLPQLPSGDPGMEDILHLKLFQPLTLRMVVEKLGGRYSSIPLDLISAIAYPLGCPILPIYDPDEDVEIAWHLLVQCLPPLKRTHLLFTDHDPVDMYSSWIPPWEQVRSGRHLREIEGELDEDEHLEYLEGSSPELGYRQGLDVYYHRPFVIQGCWIKFDRALDGELKCFIRVPLANRTYRRFRRHRVSEWGAALEKHMNDVTDTPYVLISVGTFKYWVVARMKRVRHIYDATALEVYKVSTLRIPSISGDPNAVERFIEEVEGSTELVIY